MKKTIKKIVFACIIVIFAFPFLKLGIASNLRTINDYGMSGRIVFSDSHILYEISPGDEKPQELYRKSEEDLIYFPKMLTNGDVVFVVEENYLYNLYKLTGSNAEIIKPNINDARIDIARNKNFIIYIQRYGKEIHLLNLNNMQDTKLIPDSETPLCMPTISPNGDRLATLLCYYANFQSTQYKNSTNSGVPIFISKIEGNRLIYEKTVIADGMDVINDMQWSPVRDEILISGSDTVGKKGIFILDLRTNKVTKVCYTPLLTPAGISWSPDGKYIIYSLDDALFVVTRNGNHIYDAFKYTVFGDFPYWSSKEISKKFKAEIWVDRGCGSKYREGDPIIIYYRVNKKAKVTIEGYLNDRYYGDLITRQTISPDITYSIKAKIGKPCGHEKLLLKAWSFDGDYDEDICEYISEEKCNLPKPPTDLEAEVMTSTTVKLAWKDNSNNEDGFKIYMNDSYLDKVGANISTYTVSDLIPYTSYTFYVKAYNECGESERSNVITVKTKEEKKPDLIVEEIRWLPEQPQVGDEVQFTVNIKNIGNSSIKMKFISVKLLIDGKVFSVEKTFVIRLDVNENKDITFDKKWIAEKDCHKVSAFVDSENKIEELREDNNKIEKDNLCSAKCYLPNPPSDLRYEFTTEEKKISIKLLWKDEAYNEEGFKIYKKEDSGILKQIDQVGKNVTEYIYTLNEEIVAQDYVFYVSAYNKCGESEKIKVTISKNEIIRYVLLNIAKERLKIYEFLKELHSTKFNEWIYKTYQLDEIKEKFKSPITYIEMLKDLFSITIGGNPLSDFEDIVDLTQDAFKELDKSILTYAFGKALSDVSKENFDKGRFISIADVFEEQINNINEEINILGVSFDREKLKEYWEKELKIIGLNNENFSTDKIFSKVLLNYCDKGLIERFREIAYNEARTSSKYEKFFGKEGYYIKYMRSLLGGDRETLKELLHKYLSVEEPSKNCSSTTKISLQIGNTEAEVNGIKTTLDAPPVIENGRTLVPLRFIAEAFSADVSWDGELRIVTIKLNSIIIKLQVDNLSVIIQKDGKTENLLIDVPPKIYPPGRVFVPLRFIAEAFSADVSWDGETKTVTIIYKPNLKPDLIVEDIWWSPFSPKEGGRVTIKAKIKNIGDIVTDGFDTKLYIDNSSYSTKYTSSLSPGSSTTITFSSWEAKSGCHDLKVYVDSGYDVLEANENNNTRIEQICISEKEQKEIQFVENDISDLIPSKIDYLTSWTEDTNYVYVAGIEDEVSAYIIKINKSDRSVVSIFHHEIDYIDNIKIANKWNRLYAITYSKVNDEKCNTLVSWVIWEISPNNTWNNIFETQHKEGGFTNYMIASDNYIYIVGYYSICGAWGTKVIRIDKTNNCNIWISPPGEEFYNMFNAFTTGDRIIFYHQHAFKNPFLFEDYPENYNNWLSSYTVTPYLTERGGIYELLGKKYLVRGLRNNGMYDVYLTNYENGVSKKIFSSNNFVNFKQFVRTPDNYIYAFAEDTGKHKYVIFKFDKNMHSEYAFVPDETSDIYVAYPKSLNKVDNNPGLVITYKNHKKIIYSLSILFPSLYNVGYKKYLIR